MIFQAEMHSILLYGGETWPVRVARERMLAVFDNDIIRRILRVRGEEGVESRRRYRFTSKIGSIGLVTLQDV